MRSCREGRGAGGKVLLAPMDVGAAGRMAVFADPEGAAFRVWQAGRTAGAQLVNAPGAWNWSDLETRDVDGREGVLRRGVRLGDQDGGLRRGPVDDDPGPGLRRPPRSAHPGHARQAQGARRARGLLGRDRLDAAPAIPEGPARWAVTFSVADADETAARTPDLGGTVLVEPFDVPYVRMAVVRDPDGVTFAIGKFQPPSSRGPCGRGARQGRVAVAARSGARAAAAGAGGRGRRARRGGARRMSSLGRGLRPARARGGADVSAAGGAPAVPAAGRSRRRRVARVGDVA